MVEELGADAYIYGSTGEGADANPVVARVDGRTPPQKGSVINLVPDHGHVHLFNTETGQRIGD